MTRPANGRMILTGTVGPALLLVLATILPGVGFAQTAPLTLRVALLPEWSIARHGAELDRLREAVGGGVVDRAVFAGPRGVVQRRALPLRPVRVHDPAEATSLGGRGGFRVGAVRLPAGRAAWTEVEVVADTAGPGDAVVLEVGGELGTFQQRVGTVLVQAAGGALRRVAVVPGEGIAVVRAPFGCPLDLADPAGRFHDVEGLGILVVRSAVETVPNGATTTNGPAGLSPLVARGADWREGDRVLLRVPLALLLGEPPALVLGWGDRCLVPDPDVKFPRRSSLGPSLGG